MIEIDTREWKFILVITSITVAIIFAPVVIGLYATPNGSVFIGTQRMNATDTPVYYSWIEQAKEGHLLFKNLYTPENEPRFIFDPFWLGIGLFAKIFSLSGFAAYQLSKLFLIIFFLVFIYIFISYFFINKIKRKICFIFLIFASGIGGLVWCVANVFQVQTWLPPMDIWAVETVTFYELYQSPHFIASLTLTLLVFLLLLLSLDKNKMAYSVGAGFSALFLFLFHPYNIPIVWGISGGYLAIKILRASSLRWTWIKHLAILILTSLPAVIYHLWTLQNFWSRQQHAIQNNLDIPSLSSFLLTYGFIWLLTIAGIAFLLRRLSNDRAVFLLTWLGVQLALSFSPIFNFQRKSLEGFHVVMVIVATYGIFSLKNYLGSRKFFQENYLKITTLLIFVAIPIFAFSNLTILMHDIYFYLNHENFAFIPQKKVEAMAWLRSNSSEDSIIMASHTNGNLIPAFSVRPVYWGHWGMTADSGRKSDWVNWFFKNGNKKINGSFLKFNKIDYLFYGSEERLLGNFNPEQANYLEKVYQNEETAIYKVL